MKHIFKLTSAILIVAILFSALPIGVGAVKPVKERAVFSQITCEPILPSGLQTMRGGYATYVENADGAMGPLEVPFDSSVGMVDYRGNVVMSKTGGFLSPLPNGCAVEWNEESTGHQGWALLDPNGTPLTVYRGESYSVVHIDSQQKDYMHIRIPGSGIVLDADGNSLFAKDYVIVSGIMDDMVSYMNTQKKYGVDKFDGTQVIPPEYESIKFDSNGNIIFEQDGKSGVMRPDQTVILPAQYYNILDKEGYYSVGTTDGRGLFTVEGVEVLPCIYDVTVYLGDGLIRVVKDEKSALYDVSGKQILDFEYNRIPDSVPGAVHVFKRELENGSLLWTVVLADGTVLEKDIESECVKPAEDLYLVQKGNDTEVYDLEGKLVNTIKDAAPLTIIEGEDPPGMVEISGSRVWRGWKYPAVCRDGKYALIGYDGTLVTDFCEDIDSSYEKEALSICKDGKWYLIDRNGNDLLGFPVEEIRFFEESDFVAFRVEGKYGLARIVGPDDSLFLDVPLNAWYSVAVEDCWTKEKMNGTGVAEFSPTGTMTRSMAATVLHRLAGAQEAEGSNPFPDVEAGQWYSDAVIWAAGEKIIEGYGNGSFGTNDPVTREQLVTMLWRYQGKPAGEAGALEAFADAAEISAWAEDAFAWAVDAGVIQGKTGGILDPKGTITRAEVAQILMNYDNLK